MKGRIEDPEAARILADSLRWLVTLYDTDDPEQADAIHQEWKRVLPYTEDAGTRLFHVETAEGKLLVEKGKLLRQNAEGLNADGQAEEVKRNLIEASRLFHSAARKLQQVRERQRQLVEAGKLDRDSAEIIDTLQALAGAWWATEELDDMKAAEAALNEALEFAEARYGEGEGDAADIPNDLIALRRDIEAAENVQPQEQ